MTAVMDRETSDVAIIEASRRDADRFGLLYDRYCAMLYRYAYRRLGPSGSAEDVVADAFALRFFSERHSMAQRVNFFHRSLKLRQV